MEGAGIIGFVLTLIAIWAAVGLVAHMVARGKALEAVLWAAADPGLRFVEQWEVRAMGAFIWQNLPSMRWVSYFVAEEEFERLCVAAWRRVAGEYAAADPRDCAELFGDAGPF